MGMAASQARFLGLTARKNNVEYEGQQINQQRTTLSNETANYYNDLLGMSVPVPPSAEDYTKVVYSFEDGALTNSISTMIAQPNGEYLISYTSNWVDDFAIVSASSSIVTRNINATLISGSASNISEANTSKLKRIGDSSYTYDGFVLKGPENFVEDQIPEELKNTNMSEGSYYYYEKETARGKETHYIPVADIDNKIEFIAKKSPNGATQFSLNGSTFSYGSHVLTVKRFDDEFCPEPLITANEYLTYTDDKGNEHYFEQASVEECFEKDNNNNLSTKLKENFTPVPHYVYTKEASLNGNDTVDDYISTVSYEYNVGAKKFRILGSELKGTDIKNTDEYYKNLEVDEVSQLLEEEQQYLALLKEQYGGDDNSWMVRYVLNTTSNVWEPSFTKLDDLGKAIYTDNGSSLSYIPMYKVGSLEKNEEVKNVRARFEQDSTGRLINVTLRPGEEDEVTYAVSTNTVTDQAKYDDAMNQYEYDKAQYDQTIQEINAKIEIIQAEDKNLELRLKQLDTEQRAISTEIDAVSQVIQKNVESSFKTFG